MNAITDEAPDGPNSAGVELIHCTAARAARRQSYVMPFPSSRILAVLLLTLAGLAGSAGCSKQTEIAGSAAAVAEAATIPYAFILGKESDADRRMLMAAGRGNPAEIEKAIAEGGNVEAKDMIGETPMFAAAFRNQPDVIRMLANKGANVSQMSSVGQTPLHTAVVVGANAAVEALLDAGANVNAKAAGGKTALQVAVAIGRGDIAQLLRSHGARDVVAPAAKSQSGAAKPEK